MNKDILIEPIKQLSVMYKVTSMFCHNCKRYRYHKIIEKVINETDSTLIVQSVICNKCKFENDTRMVSMNKKGNSK